MSNKEDVLLLIFLAVVGLVAVYAMYSALSIILFPPSQATNFQNAMAQRTTSMGLSSFDKKIALEFMDKNMDGRCDLCGMDVNLCMDSGQIQCNMDPKSTIGVLGSAHSHANFRVFIDGSAINFANLNYYMKSSFLHLDDSPNKEEASGVLHMHATGIPLWMLFESIGWKFSKDCLVTDSGDRYCNSGTTTLKFYVNGKPNDRWENYVFSDSDKILISYGDETNLMQQLNSIPNFAVAH